MKRKGKRMIISILLFCLLSGCGIQSENVQDQDDAVSEESIRQQENLQETGREENKDGVVQTDQEEDPRIVITFGMWGEIEGLSADIYAFNQTNENYRIEVVTYDSLEFEDYLSNRIVKLMAGKGEDLLYLGNDNRINAYMEKGVLTDLSPYMVRDLNEEDYLADALYAYEYEEGVYAIGPNFWVTPLWGNIRDLGESGQICFQDLSKILEESGANSLMGRDKMTTLWYLYNYFGLDLSDKEELQQGILLAEIYEDKGIGQENERLVLGKDALVFEMAITKPEDIINFEMAYGTLGEKTVMLEGMSLHCLSVGINEASTEKEGAWEFIRFMLSEERQMKRAARTSFGLPIFKKAFEEKIENDYAWLEKQYDSLSVPLKKEEYLELMEDLLQKSVPTAMKIDYDAWNIVREEVESYYSGKKPLNVVLDVIQSRLNMYLSE